MIVRELIERLQALPDELAEVVVYGRDETLAPATVDSGGQLRFWTKDGWLYGEVVVIGVDLER